MTTLQLQVTKQDRIYAENRIQEIEQAILDLGEDFRDAFTQSSETWHDNSPFEAVRDKQSILAAELQSLRNIIATSTTCVAKTTKTAGIGNDVTVVSKTSHKQMKYRLGGDWTPHPGKNCPLSNTVSISRTSPIGKEIFGEQVGHCFKFQKDRFEITAIEISYPLSG